MTWGSLGTRVLTHPQMFFFLEHEKSKLAGQWMFTPYEQCSKATTSPLQKLAGEERISQFMDCDCQDHPQYICIYI